jgi:PEP-CTERM motif
MYTGDFDNTSGANSTIAGMGGTAIVYNDFTVQAGQTWTVSSVFANDFLSTGFVPLLAHWTIREGVVTADMPDPTGGTVVASGTGAATVTSNGTNFVGFNGYTVAVSGLNFTLSAGTYWLAVTPIDGTGTNFGYIATTSGANAVGTSGSDSFVVGSFYVNNGFQNLDPASNVTTGANGLAIFSEGIIGTSMGGAVPEPSTLVLGSIGALALLGYAWRSRRSAGFIGQA